jgi:hypothetical protein
MVLPCRRPYHRGIKGGISMPLSIVTGGNLEIAPFKLEELVEFKLSQAINDHARLYFKGVISETLKDQPVHDTAKETQVEVSQIDHGVNKTLLFKGIVSRVEVKAVRDIYYLEVEAISLTQMLDVKLKSRSFQNENMTYQALIKQVVNEYNGDIQDRVSNGKKIGKFIMQYQETDWQFLQRLASGFNTGLIPFILSDKPKLYFGVLDSGGTDLKLENVHYRVRKKLSDYRHSSENSIPGVNEDDFIDYEVESEKKLNIGDAVGFNNTKLFVREITSYLDKSILKHQYVITPQKGLSQKTVYNDQIVGLSVEGRVLEVAKDNVKVHLQIDAKQNAGEAFWFPYSSVYTAEGNSGWYCMPEKDDYVRIYFPNKKEEEGVAISSVRKDSQDSKNNKVSNPDIKYFRTKSGKELMLSPSEIIITGKDDQIYLKLNDKDGITLYSQKAVKIIAKEDLSIESEQSQVIIKAKEGINISCDASKISMDKTSVVVTGDEVKTN